MGLIDTHAHLTSPELLEPIEDVLRRCEQAEVERVITIGTDLDDVRRAIELAERFDGRLDAAGGFHPHEAGKVGEEDLSAIAELWDHPRIVALGEMGLDYHYDFSDRASQQHVFSQQLQAAAGRSKPIVVHCREAYDDVERLLLRHGFADRRVVFHCFSGTAAEAERIAGNGWRISFTGIVTFPKSGELQRIAAGYPADQLMIETDSPYLSPVPVRGRRPNEPANLVYTARFLAELRGVSFEKVVRETSCNAQTFFCLDAPSNCT